MHTGRRYRPRGGKSNRRKQIRESFAVGFGNSLGNILDQSSQSSRSVAPVTPPKAPVATPPTTLAVPKPSGSPSVVAVPKPNASSSYPSQGIASPSRSDLTVPTQSVDLSSTGQTVDFPASAFVEEISSEEEVETVETGGQASDYRPVRRLRDVSRGVDQAVFDLPDWIPGSVIVNKVAFQDPDGGGFLLGSVSDLFDSLKGCVVLDLFKTVIFPERLSSGDSIKLAKHRGEYQTIELETLSFIFQLQRNNFTFCACSYIGRAASGEYLEALTQSELSAVIPVLFVIHNRSQKADLAKELSAIGAIDDQSEVVRQYQRAGVFAIEVGRGFGIATHKDNILQQLCAQAGVQPERDVRPKGVLTAGGRS